MESDFDLRATRRNRELNVDEGEDAITVMRRRYDVRHQEQKRSTPSNNFPSRPATPAPKPQPPQPTYNADRLKRVVTTPSAVTSSPLLLPTTKLYTAQKSHLQPQVRFLLYVSNGLRRAATAFRPKLFMIFCMLCINICIFRMLSPGFCIF